MLRHSGTTSLRTLSNVILCSPLSQPSVPILASQFHCFVWCFFFLCFWFNFIFYFVCLMFLAFLRFISYYMLFNQIVPWERIFPKTSVLGAGIWLEFAGNSDWKYQMFQKVKPNVPQMGDRRNVWQTWKSRSSKKHMPVLPNDGSCLNFKKSFLQFRLSTFCNNIDNDKAKRFKSFNKIPSTFPKNCIVESCVGI